MGLRIGEVCKLHIGNIDFDKRELTFTSEKARKIDALLIPLDLFKETVEFIGSNESKIKSAPGNEAAMVTHLLRRHICGNTTASRFQPNLLCVAVEFYV
ncbi:MAG: hypothetical protein ACREBF_00810 [Candidatus Micrarchaeales archaeon]